jgi:hypothetical protein
METVIGIVIATFVLLPMLAWIGALLWAARQDGRDEEECRRARGEP